MKLTVEEAKLILEAFIFTEEFMYLELEEIQLLDKIREFIESEEGI